MSVQLLKTNNRAKAWLMLFGAIMALTLSASAQFSSGSNGADGALDYSTVTPGSVVIFDPTKFTAVPHVAGQNVFNFTTITIPANVTVVLSGQNLTGPVFWLAQGDVRINGTLTLSGQTGPGITTDVALRVPAIAGPGGYSGGVGGNNSSPGTAGNGPGGGRAGNFNQDTNANPGNFTGSVTGPLVGGSGGGGAVCLDPNFGAGGGAGGGALLIASSTSITVNGLISANGGGGPGNGGDGNCGCAGGGSGGAIRLAANAISGSGSVTAGPGSSCRGPSAGSIQFEAFSISGVGSSPAASQGAPGALFLPTVAVSIQVVSIAGIPLPTSPSGSFQTPDVVINSSSPVPVAIQTSGIPPGTALTLFIFSENGSFQTVQTTNIQGTLQSGTATANVTFSPDLSLGYVKATWTQ